MGDPAVATPPGRDPPAATIGDRVRALQSLESRTALALSTEAARGGLAGMRRALESLRGPRAGGSGAPDASRGPC